jgi:inosine/xanthosine triphosphatase
VADGPTRVVPSASSSATPGLRAAGLDAAPDPYRHRLEPARERSSVTGAPEHAVVGAADRGGADPLAVGVGSGNPVKRDAVAAAFERAGLRARVDAVPVPSGVPEQPWGRAETLRGASNRANAVLATDADGYDLGVGVEGGVAPVAGADDDGPFLVMWAVVTDGETTGRGAGPSLELPADVAARLRDGAELGPVMDDRLGETGVARGRGAAGALTAGALDREAALASAAVAALGPFLVDAPDDAPDDAEPT